jgi:outer membrane receptor protein involved in Fe transport
VKEGSIAPYVEASWTALDSLRLFAGARADFYTFEVMSRQEGFADGDASDQIFSPKLGIAYAVHSKLELYGNWGRGFHSNDARGVAAPLPGNDPVQGLIRGEGQELGARVQLGDLSLTATYWWLDVGSELKFVGDSNSVEPSTPSKRRGYELVGFWRPLPWFAVDAVWTGSRARALESPGAEFLPGAIENAGELGISAIRKQWEASVRVRHLGSYPLIEDDSLRADAETIVNVRGAWKARRLTAYAEVLNVFDDHGKDIVYFYEAHVPGLDPEGEQTEGRISRAVEPRTLRVGLRYDF